MCRWQRKLRTEISDLRARSPALHKTVWVLFSNINILFSIDTVDIKRLYSGRVPLTFNVVNNKVALRNTAAILVSLACGVSSVRYRWPNDLLSACAQFEGKKSRTRNRELESEASGEEGTDEGDWREKQEDGCGARKWRGRNSLSSYSQYPFQHCHNWEFWRVT